jgi:hypothetical protein
MITQTLSKEIIKEKGLVILPLRKYEKLKEKIEKLEREKRSSAEETEVLGIIAEGEREYKEKKLVAMKSLADLN